jgi:multimeric flavodoxin WrbA
LIFNHFFIFSLFSFPPLCVYNVDRRKAAFDFAPPALLPRRNTKKEVEALKITAIYGNERKGCTWHVARQFIEQLKEKPENITEFFLPKDGPGFCRGCFACFTDFTKCPDYEKMRPIFAAIDQADLLIFTSPVYVYHVTGQMKALLDHFAFRWMAHQPSPAMFKKQGLIISTAAGAGMKATIKGIADSFDFWGVGKIYRYGKSVAAADWNGISEKTKGQIQKDARRLGKKIKAEYGLIRPSLKVKGLFYMMRFMHKKWAFNPPDVAHWKTQGWLDKTRPW